MALSARLCVLLVSTLFAVAFARPGAPSYPADDENTILDYTYDSEEESPKSEGNYNGGWKAIYSEKLDADSEKGDEYSLPATTPPEPAATQPPTTPTTAPTTGVPFEQRSDIQAPGPVDAPNPMDAPGGPMDAVRAVDVVNPAGAVAAVQAVEVVKAAFESTTFDPTTTVYPQEGRSYNDEREQADAPNADQQLYGISKFLHDLLQVPVQVMRSVSSYLSAAFNSRSDNPSTNSTPEEHTLNSAMLSQSF